MVLTALSCRPPRRPNVLWIIWDTVRADHLGLYGYERDTTPNLDRWAAGARVFEDCLSTAGYTLPSLRDYQNAQQQNSRFGLVLCPV